MVGVDIVKEMTKAKVIFKNMRNTFFYPRARIQSI